MWRSMKNRATSPPRAISLLLPSLCINLLHAFQARVHIYFVSHTASPEPLSSRWSGIKGSTRLNTQRPRTPRTRTAQSPHQSGGSDTLWIKPYRLRWLIWPDTMALHFLTSRTWTSMTHRFRLSPTLEILTTWRWCYLVRCRGRRKCLWNWHY